jgi:hypothetical protein
MSYDLNGFVGECVTCGRYLSSPRYGPGAMECRDCERFGPPPKTEYVPYGSTDWEKQQPWEVTQLAEVEAQTARLIAAKNKKEVT